MDNEYIKIFTEKKTTSLGTRVKPTIKKFLKELSESEDLSVNELIEVMVLERHSARIKERA